MIDHALEAKRIAGINEAMVKSRGMILALIAALKKAGPWKVSAPGRKVLWSEFSRRNPLALEIFRQLELKLDYRYTVWELAGALEAMYGFRKTG